jgi:hypothetical protein
MANLTRNFIRVLFVVIILLFTATYGMASVQKEADPWLDPVITKGELQSTTWINTNTPLTAHFQSDIFGGELIMGTTARTPIVGGDWANAPDPITNMKDSQQIYQTDSASEAHTLCKEHNLSYAFVPLNRLVFCGFGWVSINAAKFDNSSYFKLKYSNEDVKIYAVA